MTQLVSKRVVWQVSKKQWQAEEDTLAFLTPTNTVVQTDGAPQRIHS
jgi:hypothetical protein